MAEMVGERTTDPSSAVGSFGSDGDRWLASLTDTLNRPISAWICVLGWVASIGLFVGLTAIFAGPSVIDMDESVYSTWAIAHGQIACAYPPVIQPSRPPIAPLYPLLSGGIVAITQIGHGAPFPSAAALGPDCRNATGAMDSWSLRSGAIRPTLWIGCLCWPALMAGVIAWLRASGRGRRGWEPVSLVVIATLLPVWGCVQNFFHPQDLLAMGLALSAVACARRGRWLLGGVLCALAILSQQYALLVAVPLFVVAPSTKRVRFAAAGVVTGAIVVLPLMVMTSGRVLHGIALGTGDYPWPGGTVLWETHASGAAGVLLFRVAPVAISFLLSWWVVRRLGPGALDPVPLISLVAVSLGLRLVFEPNLITYYFMALAVSLVLLEVTRGSIRRTVVAWLASLTVVTCRMSLMPFGTNRWGVYFQNDLIPLLFGGVAILAILRCLLRGGDRRNVLPWVAVAAVDLFTLSPFDNPFSSGQVVWFWQIALVVPGLFLAVQPLRGSIRQSGSALPDSVHHALSPGV
jgi:hypothetical protein